MQKLRRKEKINKREELHCVALLEKNEEVTVVTEDMTRGENEEK